MGFFYGGGVDEYRYGSVVGSCGCGWYVEMDNESRIPSRILSHDRG